MTDKVIGYELDGSIICAECFNIDELTEEHDLIFNTECGETCDDCGYELVPFCGECSRCQERDKEEARCEGDCGVHVHGGDNGR